MKTRPLSVFQFCFYNLENNRPTIACVLIFPINIILIRESSSSRVLRIERLPEEFIIIRLNFVIFLRIYLIFVDLIIIESNRLYKYLFTFERTLSFIYLSNCRTLNITNQPEYSKHRECTIKRTYHFI